MKRILLTVVVLLLMAVPLQADGPRVGPERVVFNTPSGDIVFAFYPQVAPRHVKQFLKLVENGVYDHFHFWRIEPGFVLQLTDQGDRMVPLTSKQEALIHSLKAEFSNLKHRRGVLSMARLDNDVDSAKTSFSIVLGDAPHLDGHYTIFGHVEQGMDVVEELCKAPRNGNRSRVPLEVYRAILLDSADQLSLVPLVKAHPLDLMKLQMAADTTVNTLNVPPSIAGGLVLMIAIGLACYYLSNRLPPRVLVSLLLIDVLIGGFLTLILVTPLGHTYHWLSVAAFAGLLGLLKLMSRFESAA
jgi:cyclophilin family peptidyl-prolyl cis-trans isomerase